jgi:hypothetical protein
MLPQKQIHMQKLKTCWRGAFFAVHPKAQTTGQLRQFNAIVSICKKSDKTDVVIIKKVDDNSDIIATVSFTTLLVK